MKEQLKKQILINPSDIESIKKLMNEIKKSNTINEKEIEDLSQTLSECIELLHKKFLRNKKTKQIKGKSEKEKLIQKLIYLKKLLYEKILPENQEFNEKFKEIFDQLREKFQDTYTHYLTYHILAGSTFYKEDIQYFDFPGEDSLIRKILALIQEMQINHNLNLKNN